jgi:NAD(P)-dependent dehydrogenase (short-subunit alcohol dehydrogenase family)
MDGIRTASEHQQEEETMKIVLVGAGGTLGQAVAAELGARHEIVPVGKTRGDRRVDMADLEAVRRLFAEIGTFDAVVSTAGHVHFGPMDKMGAAEYGVGLADKLMGQVNLVLAGRERIADGGSFTLTSGILTDDPIRFGTSASMVNGALEAFARAAAIELPRGLRINVVSPTVLTESLDAYGPYFRGFSPVPAARAALAFAKSVEGAQTGQVYRVFG